jgi:hypothetical protein
MIMVSLTWLKVCWYHQHSLSVSNIVPKVGQYSQKAEKLFVGPTKLCTATSISGARLSKLNWVPVGPRFFF